MMPAIMPSSSTSRVPAASSTLYVDDLHPDVTEAHLLNAFSEFEGLVAVRLCISLDAATRKSRRYGYVNFSSPLGADMAIKAKNRSKLNGKEMIITWSHLGTGKLSAKNSCNSIDNMMNGCIQVSRSMQPSGQSKYVPPLGRHAGVNILGITPLSAEEICRRKAQRLRRRLKFSTPEQQRTILETELQVAVEMLEEFTLMTSARIAEKIMEMDSEEVLGLLDTPESLSAKVDEVVEELVRTNDPDQPRFVAIDFPCPIFPLRSSRY